MSDIVSIQSEIADAAAQVPQLHAELDSLYLAFGASLVPVAKQWMEHCVQRSIAENADAVNNRGLDALRAFKDDFQALLGRLPELCERALGDRDAWPHRRDRVSTVDREPTGESLHAAIFRRAINPLGSLLSEHGLLSRRGTERVGEWTAVGAEGFRYAINTGVDLGRSDALRAYTEKVQALVALSQLLKGKHEALAKARAKALWDQA